MLARLTNETESGSLPTPVKYDTGGRGEGDNYHGLGWQAKYVGDVQGPAGLFPKGFKPSEERTKKMWSTPVAHEDRAQAYTRETSYRHHQEGRQTHLAQEARDTRMWPTPTASDQGRKPPSQLRRTRTGLLESDTGTYTQLCLGSVAKAEAMQLPVPPEPSRQAQEGLWPTPMCTGLRGGSGVPKDQNERLGLPTPTMQGLNGGTNGREAAETRGTYVGIGELNPDWVEWIMGWPIGWTSLEPMPDSNMYDWYGLTGAQDDGENMWWKVDPSDHPETKVPKTTVSPTKKAEKIRISRIAALGNGQVSAAAAGAWTILINMKLPEGI